MICTQICDCIASSLDCGCSLPLLGKVKVNKTLQPLPCTLPLHFSRVRQLLPLVTHKPYSGATHWRRQSGAPRKGTWGVLDDRYREPWPSEVVKLRLWGCLSAWQFICIWSASQTWGWLVHIGGRHVAKAQPEQSSLFETASDKEDLRSNGEILSPMTFALLQ